MFLASTPARMFLFYELVEVGRTNWEEYMGASIKAKDLLFSIAQLKKQHKLANPQGKKLIEKEATKVRELLWKETHKT